MRQMTTREYVIFAIILSLLVLAMALGVGYGNKKITLYASALAHGCEIKFDRRVICAEHADRTAHGCAKDDIIIENITCEDGRRAEYKLRTDGSTWSWKK